MAHRTTGNTKQSWYKKLGDKIERVGEKLSQSSPKLGSAVHRVGDKIEHMRGGKKDRH